jgi:hypothetical protein
VSAVLGLALGGLVVIGGALQFNTVGKSSRENAKFPSSHLICFARPRQSLPWRPDRSIRSPGAAITVRVRSLPSS